MRRVRILARSLGRTHWKCGVCGIWVDDHLTRCPVQH